MAKPVNKGDIIDLPECRAVVTSEPVLNDHVLSFDVEQVPFTPCPSCASRNTAQWIKSDDRYPSWLCSQCGVEWNEPEEQDPQLQEEGQPDVDS